MKHENRPDNVVYNEAEQRYDAALRPYPTNVGAPVIRITDTLAWKNRVLSKVNHRIGSKFNELKKEYNALMDEYKWNSMVLNAKFSFEPVVGEIYHLYQRENGDTFLSLIAPEQCNFNAVGSFYLDADMIWKKI